MNNAGTVCIRLNETVTVYNSRGEARETKTYGHARQHVSQRERYLSNIYNFDNMYVDYQKGDFSHSDCVNFYEFYDQFGEQSISESTVHGSV